ncbi:MAG: DUF6438 domain-containing protein [Bacteroidia bacterium]
MKKNVLLLIIFLCSSYSYSQSINELNSFKKVAKFLNKEVSKKYTFESVFENEKEADEEAFNEVVKKIDVDNNGHTDLIINAYKLFIIVLSNGQSKFKELSFKNKNRFLGNTAEFDSITKIRNETVFIFNTEIDEDDETVYANVITKKGQKKQLFDLTTKEYKWVIEDIKFRVDSLTIKFGELVSYTNKKSVLKNKIKDLHFYTTGCFGTCPIFELNLNSNGDLRYTGKKFTNYEGIKTTKLDSTDLENLFGLLEYADLKNLKDFYSVTWTDDQTGILKVTFENEEVKEIQDYGLRGTIDLQAIYAKLFEINKKIK